MNDAKTNGVWPVRDLTNWVYPAAAVLPMIWAKLGHDLTHFSFMVSWLSLITVFNALACLAMWLMAGRRRALLGIAAWIVFLALLGPTALSRVDSAAAPLIVIGLAAIPVAIPLATSLLTLGAWVKVAPGAVVLPLLMGTRRSVLRVVVPGLAVCLAVLGVAVAFGCKPSAVLGFFGRQAGRGLQLESVAATPFVISRARQHIEIAQFNNDLGTYETQSAQANGVAGLLDLVLVALAVAIALLVLRARLRGAWQLVHGKTKPLGSWRARFQAVRQDQHGKATPHNQREVLMVAALAALTAMIVANKVGSPQFVAWIGPPMALGLALWPTRRWWQVVGAGVGVIAVLTHLIYPTIYMSLLSGQANAVAVLAVRNAGLVILLLACLFKLWNLGTAGGSPDCDHTDDAAAPDAASVRLAAPADAR
jgi:hypothetical protein